MPEPPTPRDRARGALLGLAAGDALGTTVEFRRPGSFRPLTDIVGGGPFSLRAGQWTDDTSMAICLAESLLDRRRFDPADQLRRYLRWYREGHNSSTGHCFDIGGATSAALTRFERDPGNAYPGDAAPDAAGNGPLMKLAPIPIAYAADPPGAVVAAARSARTTHGAPTAADACRYFTGLLIGALGGTPKERLLVHHVLYEPRAVRYSGERMLHPEIALVARGSYRDRHPPEIRGTGYIVHALEAALWAVAHHDTFAETVLGAANLGDDADTTAAIAGQLAGALYGVEGIPAAWRARLHRHDDLVALADGLHDLQPEDLQPLPPAGPPLLGDELPPPGADHSTLAHFAMGFDGYAHFGDVWGPRYQEIRGTFQRTGELPDDVDDLRGVLFVAVRALRFNGEDTILVETSPGHFEVRNDPDFADGPLVAFERAVVERLRGLLAAG